MPVIRLGYIQVRVTDMEEAVNHYSNTLGMKIVATGQGGPHMSPHGISPGKLTYLKAWDEWDHHSVVLEEGGVGLVKFGYKVSSADDLAVFEKRVQQFGATTQRMSKGENLAVGDGFRVTLPSDHVLELYHEMEYIGTETGALNPPPWPRDGRGAAVPRLDHCLYTAEDPELDERFWAECLDFRAGERLITDPSDPELIGTWMYCGQTPHDVAVIKGPNGKLHHFAFLLEDWNAILRAGDVFGMDEVSVDIGPTRHGITRGTTIYFFDPSGNRNEVFSGGYLTGPDFPTITWTADQLGRGIFYISGEVNERFTTVVT
jgi:catechol 2,3-dioxygenase